MANYSTLLGIYYIMYIYVFFNFWQKIRSSTYFNVAKISTEFIFETK